METESMTALLEYLQNRFYRVEIHTWPNGEWCVRVWQQTESGDLAAGDGGILIGNDDSFEGALKEAADYCGYEE